MGKIRVGNKQNSILNQIWAKHGRKDGKSLANAVRRQIDKMLCRQEIE